MSSIRYQPHIDGLRALAVTLVILHHLGDWAGLSGGYVGVDVFFVISGFLITSIVKTEIEAGRFSFGDFYKRRIVRLAPAYFTVLITTSVAALAWMLPAELIEYARSVVASSLFLANFHMWKEVGGYFGVAGDTTPLLHLWSLAVEEQFYLLWPVVLLIAHRCIGKRWMPWLVLAVTVGGVALSQWGVTRFPAAGYYLLPTRFFELALGAVLAYLSAPKMSAGGRSIVSAIGLLLILYSALTYGKQTLFPGYAGLVPVLGTALLLRWGGLGIFGVLLSAPALTFVGRISYPAYLWHWPIIAFLNINEVTISAPIGLMVIFLTFALALLTYYGIERPARRLLVLPVWRIVSLGAGVPISVFVAAALSVVSLQGLPSRFPDSLNLKSAAMLAYTYKTRGRCNEAPPTAPLSADECVLGRADGKVDFLLVGDSHANHFTGFMDELGKAAGMRGYDMTRSQTAFLPDVDFWTYREGKPDHHEHFVPRNRFVSELLKREEYRFVVLAGSWLGYFGAGELLKSGALEGEAAFKAGMRAAIHQARAAAETTVVIRMVPPLAAGLHDCSLRNERFGLAQDCTLPIEEYDARMARMDAFFEVLSEEFPDVVWVDPAEIMCDGERCVTEIDGIPLYRDGGHLNDMGSRLLAKKWLTQFGNPLDARSPEISMMDRSVP